MEYEYKIKYLRNYFKKNKNVFELILNKYENFDYYIRVDYNPKLKGYYLYSINLKNDSKKIDKFINRQFINAEALNSVLTVFDNFNYDSYEKVDFNKDIIELYIKDKYFKFNRYIPENLIDLSYFIFLVAFYMPNRMHVIFEEMVASINGKTYIYDYLKEFKFDLYKDKLDKVFSEETIEKGTEIFESEKVKFLEKFENNYLALVEGHDNYAYIVQIDYNEEENETKATTTCTCVGYCKHRCAAILAIRKKKFNNFYKIRLLRKNEDALTRLLDISNSLLCVGAFDDNIQVLDNNYGFVNIPILNEENNVTFEIIEDNNGELQEYVDKYLRGESHE